MSDPGPERRVLNYERLTIPPRPRELLWPLIGLGLLAGFVLFVIWSYVGIWF